LKKNDPEAKAARLERERRERNDPIGAATRRGNGAKIMANNPAAERGLKLFEKCTLFGALGDTPRRKLAEHAHPRHFAAGDAICKIDEHGDCAWR
jgi:hypothetical protein